MKLALVSPRSSFCSQDNPLQEVYGHRGFVGQYRDTWSGLGSGLLVIGALTPNDWEMALMDENREPLDFDRGFDVVAISMATQQATRGYEIADEYRRRGVHVVLGGLHPTVLPDEAQQHADTVVVGEAELLWPRFVEDYRCGQAQARYQSDEVVDLRNSPLPRYDLLRGSKPGIVWVQTTRGCPHDCEFCAATNVFGRSFRHKSVEQVVAEIESVKRLFPNTRIGLSDDNAFADRRYGTALLEKLEPLRIRWLAETDIRVAKSDEMLALAARSGCVNLFIGFESLSVDALGDLDPHGWKAKQREDYSASIRRIQSHGIGVTGAFIVGLDGDDREVFDELVQFITSHHLYDAQITILTPFPGTRLRARLDEQQRILPTPWKYYSGWDVNITHPRLAKRDLEEGVLSVYQRINTESVQSAKYAFYKEMRRQMLNKRPVPDAHESHCVDEAHERLRGNTATVQSVVEGLVRDLALMRSNMEHRAWRSFAREIRKHPIHDILNEDPLTRRAFEKPRGYPGDARCLDYVYGCGDLEGVSERGLAVMQATIGTPMGHALRWRREVIAGYVDRTAERRPAARVLALGCGHLREADIIRAIAERRLDNYVALDFDAKSLAHVQETYGQFGVRTVEGSVHDLGFADLGQFDLIYAIGLYDYLSQGAAKQLTAYAFEMLASEGRLVIANALHGVAEAGYMEALVDWWLVYRNEAEVLAIGDGVPPEEVATKRTFRDSNACLGFLELTRS